MIRGLSSHSDALALPAPGGLENAEGSVDPRPVDRVLPLPVHSAAASVARPESLLTGPPTGRFGAAEGDPRALLASAAGGDEASCRRIYRDHVDRVHRTVSRILGSHDADVDDVVQQTFLAALEASRKGGFDGRSKLSTFLIGIASRRALDAARERQRRSRWGRLPAFFDGLVPSRKEHPSDLDDRSFAVWALDQLSPEQRQAFVLHAVEGHTLQEMADMTGTGISTLHARVQSARKKLDALVAPIVSGEPEAPTDRTSDEEVPR